MISRQISCVRESSNTWDTSVPYGASVLSSNSDPFGDNDFGETDYYELLANSRDMDIRNQSYHACLETMKKFVYGKGVKIRARVAERSPEKEPTAQETAIEQATNEYFDAVWHGNGMSRKAKECNHRKNRDGDCFMSFEGQDGGTATKTVNFGGKEFTIPVFRFLSPERVRDGRGKIPLGVEVDEDDPETVLAYHYLSGSGSESRRIDAGHVIHWKCNADSDWRRGIPKLTSCMHWFRELNRFAQNAVDRTSIQNAHVLIRKAKTVSGAEAIRNQHLNTADTADNYSQKRIKGGTVISTGPGVEYQFLGPNMQGARPEDARLIFLLAASGAGLAEYMVSADASNSNYASTMISESPAVRTFEDDQDDDEHYWQLFWEKSILFGIETGQLPGNAITECVVHWPPLIHRNEKEHAEALVILESLGLSRESALSKAGFNAKEEFARSRAEVKALADLSPDVSADDEEDQARKTLQREVAEAVNFAEHDCCSGGTHEEA